MRQSAFEEGTFVDESVFAILKTEWRSETKGIT
jgi:hypothetical protein